MTVHHFWAQNGLIALNEIFFGKTINIILMCLLASLMVEIFKIILRADPELRPCIIFGPKMAHLPEEYIFRKKPLI